MNDRPGQGGEIEGMDQPTPSSGDPDPGQQEPVQIAWPRATYWIRSTIVVVLVLLAMSVLREASDVFLLILLALVLSVGLDPAVRFLVRRGLRRGLAVLVIFASAVLFLGVFLWLAIPEFVEQTRTLTQDLPGLLNDLSARDDWIGQFARHAEIKRHLQDFVSNLPSEIADSVGSIVGVTGRITGLVFRLFTLGVLTVYFTLSFPAARRMVLARAPVEDRDRLDRVVSTTTTRIGGYVSGTFVLAGLAMLAAALVLTVMGVQFWLPLAIWAGLAGVIPIVGAYLGAVPAVLIALADSPTKALVVLLYFVAWQQVRDYVLSPRIMRNSVDLSPAAVVVATILGASIGGFFGILLALPVAATIKAVGGEYLWRGRRPDEEPAGGRSVGEPTV